LFLQEGISDVFLVLTLYKKSPSLNFCEPWHHFAQLIDFFLISFLGHMFILLFYFCVVFFFWGGGMLGVFLCVYKAIFNPERTDFTIYCLLITETWQT